MDYVVKTAQNEVGLWFWTIFKGELMAETDKSNGYTTEGEARKVSADFLGDHLSGWMSEPNPDGSGCPG